MISAISGVNFNPQKSIYRKGLKNQSRTFSNHVSFGANPSKKELQEITSLIFDITRLSFKQVEENKLVSETFFPLKSINSITNEIKSRIKKKGQLLYAYEKESDLGYFSKCAYNVTRLCKLLFVGHDANFRFNKDTESIEAPIAALISSDNKIVINDISTQMKQVLKKKFGQNESFNILERNEEFKITKEPSKINPSDFNITVEKVKEY